MTWSELAPFILSLSLSLPLSLCLSLFFSLSLSLLDLPLAYQGLVAKTGFD